MRLDAKRVNIRAHDFAKSLINEPMPVKNAQPFEGLRHDAHAKVTATAASTRVPGVQMALIFDAEFHWREHLFEPGTDAF